MTRVEYRHWRERELQHILAVLEEWYLELKLIEHSRKCDRCLTELELSVSRYGGRNGPWYLDLQYETGWYPDVYEEDPVYKDCPRLENYKMGSYWTAANIQDETERQNYLRKRSAEIRRFILDRMKWGEFKIRPLTEALVDYYIEVENWDLESPISGEPTLRSLFFWVDDMEKPKPRPADLLFPEFAERKRKGLCPFCGRKIEPSEFRDEISRREYQISGLCQKCQDKIFQPSFLG